MKLKKKAKQVVMISISVMLFIATFTVCIFGEKRFNRQIHKKYNGAKEVNSSYTNTNELNKYINNEQEE